MPLSLWSKSRKSNASIPSKATTTSQDQESSGSKRRHEIANANRNASASSGNAKELAEVKKHKVDRSEGVPSDNGSANAELDVAGKAEPEHIGYLKTPPTRHTMRPRLDSAASASAAAFFLSPPRNSGMRTKRQSLLLENRATPASIGRGGVRRDGQATDAMIQDKDESEEDHDTTSVEDDDEEDETSRKEVIDGKESGGALVAKIANTVNRSAVADSQGIFDSKPGASEVLQAPPMTVIETRKPGNKDRLAPKELDESTLQHLTTYLSKGVQSQLDEVDMLNFMLRMDRVARQQVHFQRHLVASKQAVAERVTGDDDDDDSDASLYLEVLVEEEEHALARDFFRMMVQEIEKEHSIKLDPRTLAWVKRASGVHRPADPAQKLNSEHHVLASIIAGADEQAENGGPILGTRRSATRYTRGMAKQVRIKKRERGLQQLCWAIGELEADLGEKFPPYSDLKRKRDAGAEVEGGTESEASSNDDKENERAAKKIKSLAAASRSTETGRDAFSGEPKKLTKYEPSTDLAQLDRERRAKLRAEDPEPKRQGIAAYLARLEDVKLPHVYRRAGIVYSLPLWKGVQHEKRKARNSPGFRLGSFAPARQRHPDEGYAGLCKRMINLASGNLRIWAAHEFFYSDIDGPWYRWNRFEEEAAKLGVPPDANLSLAEWRIIRQHLQRKPRRFSRKFIGDELQSRNLYRCYVRRCRMNSAAWMSSPKAESMRSARYDVSMIIEESAAVSVMLWDRRELKKGTVVHYSRWEAKYRVFFADPRIGFRDCPDSTVARHGPVRLLLPAQLRYFEDPSKVDGDVAMHPLTIEDDVRKQLHFYPKKTAQLSAAERRARKSDHGALEAEVAEYESFVKLAALLEEAIERKRVLLHATETTHAMMVDELPVGGGNENSTLPSVASRNYAWLLGNLQATNERMTTVYDLFNLMYLQVRNGDMKERRGNMDNVLQQFCPIRVRPSPFCGPWLHRLQTEMPGVGASCVPPITTESGASKKRHQLSAELENWVCAVAELLCVATHCQQVAMDDENAAKGVDFEQALMAAARRFVPMTATTEARVGVDLLSQVISSREEAGKEILEALNLLASELALSRFDDTIDEAGTLH